jgi:hypothetical protein
VDLDAGWESRLDAFTDGLATALRSAGWCGSTEAMGRYCLGLLLPGERKSMEPMAARIDPEHVQAQFSSLPRLITDSVWDHQAVLDAVRNFCLPQILTQGCLEAWIADGTTFPKQGTRPKRPQATGTPSPALTAATIGPARRNPRARPMKSKGSGEALPGEAVPCSSNPRRPERGKPHATGPIEQPSQNPSPLR